MTDVLDVRYESTNVGQVRLDAVRQFCFRYADSWLARNERFPISLSLPLTREETIGGAAHAFFANLLPEGGARQAVCARLKISVDNDFALLAAIGEECAGALSVMRPGTATRTAKRHRYKKLDVERLVARDEPALLIGGPTTRLSLAGAQEKVPVALLDGALHLPVGTAPSTHILKLPNPRYPHLTVNEAFCLSLAAAIGFEVVDAQLWESSKCLLVRRYDRVTSETPWPAVRLHQEDLCQACGVPPVLKYEDEGGPPFVRVVKLLRSHVVQPLIDVVRLLRWQAFNIVVGNSDGHAKNLSILYSAGGAELAPFYDIVSTRAYKQINRMLAMRVGGRHNPDEIGPVQWTKTSAELDLKPRTVQDLVVDNAERTLDALPRAVAAFRERYGKQPALESLPTDIARRARRVARSAVR